MHIIKKHLRYIILILLFSVALTSYFESYYISFFLPLRNFLFVPNTVRGEEDGSSPFLPLKASKDGYYINPYQISSQFYSLAKEILEKKGDISIADQTAILECADYFIKNQVIKTSGGIAFSVWQYPISFTYGLKPGWISGMAQSHIACLLAAAAQLLPEGQRRNDYEDSARKAVSSFFVPVSEGGVLVDLQGDGNWYEEYAQPGVTPPMVLNGHIYAIRGLSILTGLDQRVNFLIAQGVHALKNRLFVYDAITWSYYDTLKTPANNKYQKTHTRQMLELYDYTGDPFFKKYHYRFLLQSFSPFSAIQRAFLFPNRFLIFNLAVNFLLLLAVTQVFYRLIATIKKRKEGAMPPKKKE